MSLQKRGALPEKYAPLRQENMSLQDIFVNFVTLHEIKIAPPITKISMPIYAKEQEEGKCNGSGYYITDLNLQQIWSIFYLTFQDF